MYSQTAAISSSPLLGSHPPAPVKLSATTKRSSTMPAPSYNWCQVTLYDLSHKYEHLASSGKVQPALAEAVLNSFKNKLVSYISSSDIFSDDSSSGSEELDDSTYTTDIHESRLPTSVEDNKVTTADNELSTIHRQQQQQQQQQQHNENEDEDRGQQQFIDIDASTCSITVANTPASDTWSSSTLAMVSYLADHHSDSNACSPSEFPLYGITGSETIPTPSIDLTNPPSSDLDAIYRYLDTFDHDGIFSSFHPHGQFEDEDSDSSTSSSNSAVSDDRSSASPPLPITPTSSQAFGDGAELTAHDDSLVEMSPYPHSTTIFSQDSNDGYCRESIVVSSRAGTCSEAQPKQPMPNTSSLRPNKKRSHDDESDEEEIHYTESAAASGDENATPTTQQQSLTGKPRAVLKITLNGRSKRAKLAGDRTLAPPPTPPSPPSLGDSNPSSIAATETGGCGIAEGGSTPTSAGTPTTAVH